jgi:DNA polymerase-3 subunit gamma/tau
MSFSDLVGQDHIAQTFRHAIEGNRLHHAFLFTGTRGVGKTTSARIVARTLNCTGGSTLEPCGKCPSCLDIGTGNPMDVIEIDAASNTGVDDMRTLLEQTRYTPMIGKYKVFVIDEVHMLSKHAFNALLKTLEEPPSHVIFIFATTEANKVPPTILSRVQRFDFKRISNRQIAERLQYICTQESIQADSEGLAIIADKADGSMRDALTYFDQVYAFSGAELSNQAVRQVLGIPPESIFFDMVQAIFSHDQKGCFDIIDQACGLGIELSILLDGMAKFLRNLLYSRVSGLSANALEVTESHFKQLQGLAPDASNGDILRLGKILAETHFQLKTASNPRLLVETSFARMAWLDRVADLKKILQGFDGPGTAETVKKKILRSPAPVSDPPPPPVPTPATILPTLAPLPVAPSPAPTEEFSISFGDEPAPAGPQVSKFELVNQWKTVQKDFCQMEPLAGAYLDGTVLQRGEYNISPFAVKIIFRADNAFNFNQFTKSEFYKATLTDYLETILQTKVLVHIEPLAPSAVDATASPSPLVPRQSAPHASTWERDKSREPILQFLSETFEVTWLDSKSVRRIQRPSQNDQPVDE